MQMAPINPQDKRQKTKEPGFYSHVLPAAATTSDQELELSSVTELFQSLDQSSGTPSPESIRAADGDNVHTFKRLLKTHFLNLLN